jgi:transposase
MWTPTTRQQQSRTVTRYQTDLTDAELRVIAPHLPKPCPTGRPRAWPMREIINAIFSVTRAGCPCLLPNDLPPWGTIYRWLSKKASRALPSKKMAHPTRFERVAFAFGGRRSIQLSYGCLLLTQCLRGFRV